MRRGIRFLRCITLAILAVAAAIPAFAANGYPAKPIRLIVPAAPGGALDLTTRIIAQKMSENLGQTVVVENRAGGDNLLGIRYVKEQPADGYTLLATSNGFSILPALKADPGYDPTKDFSGVGLLAISPMLILVGANQPDKTVADFVDRAKAHPDQVTYASAGVGSPPHLGAAIFLYKAGVNITHVPYKGNGAAMPDVAGGRVTMICGGYVGSIPYLKSGSVRAIAVTGDKRLAVLPNVLTFKEQGMDYTYSLWVGLVARKGTPSNLLKRISDAIHYATNSPDIAERFSQEGTEPGNDTPEQFDQFLARDAKEGTGLIAALNIPKQ